MEITSEEDDQLLESAEKVNLNLSQCNDSTNDKTQSNNQATPKKKRGRPINENKRNKLEAIE